MDKTYVKSVLEGLKSSSSKRIQESLVKIKSTIIINDKGIKSFRESGGIEYLLPHLRKPNERILDLSLSILGNVCLDEKCSLLIGKLNSYGPLVSILNTVCRDSIVGRTSRVIGNLAQKLCNAEHLHNFGAVKALLEVINNRDKSTSYATLTMAVRAIRQLWMVKDKRDEMLRLHAVQSVSILLTTECESIGIIKSSTGKEIEDPKRSQDDLIVGILKCLGYFTTYLVGNCAEQIQGDGRGYLCLVALTKRHETIALKCLMNLCYLSTCRPVLGTAGLVECLVSIIQKKHATDMAWWPDGAAKALAQLSGEAVNRSRLRRSGGLSLLVTAARDNAHAMHALLQYVFDDSSFQLLIQQGLVGLLTDKLTDHISTMEFEHNFTIGQNEAVKRKEKHKNESIAVYDMVVSNIAYREKGFFKRSKSKLLSETEDDLKVVIERDNMIVGFLDAIDSDDSNLSDSDEGTSSQRKRSLKRVRSKSPKSFRKKSHFVKMASKDWSSGVFWEPKSPEWPSLFQQFPSDKSPSRDQGPLSPASEGSADMSPDYRGSLSKKSRWDWSPDSGASMGEGSSTSPYWTDNQWSPGSSGPSSPFSINDESSDSEISGRYSPVCSEDDGDEDQKKTSTNAIAELKATQIAQELDTELTIEDDSSDEKALAEDISKCKIDMKSKSSAMACVMVLMFRVTHGTCTTCGSIRDDSVPNHLTDLLTSRECLHGLLDYVERCQRPMGRAARILVRIVSNHLCLLNLLRHRIPLRLHQMSVRSKHPTDQCIQCKQINKFSSKLLTQLSLKAESSYGIGKISYHLLKGTTSMKQTLSLTLPYFVRTEKVLKKYLIDCNGLNLLFSSIAEAKEDIDDCVTALVKLANNVHIKDPKILENRYRSNVHVTYDPILDNLAPDDIVTFQLDDSSTVKANKVFLCQHSEVFSAMLMGQFKESIEKCVQIKNVSKPALEYLFTLLQCGLNSSKNDIEIFPMAEELETNLEVLLLADRFLFDKLKEFLSSAILQFQLAPDTADKMYIWSLRDGMGFLCVESVAYLLTGQMSEAERVKSFQNILNLEYKDQLLEDIKSMLLRQLIK
ncbi:jg9219 [Pararge aegeria aegeria]|uniref:Jg9219 protein n=3 Tax=Pararge aegeria TaxID=116150 RepID=A0A8S4S9K5_9NEOP|nr:jg9219 [Pararge aegeria aegeria]